MAPPGRVCYCWPLYRVIPPGHARREPLLSNPKPIALWAGEEEAALQNKRKKWILGGIFFAFFFIAILVFVPPRAEGMDATFPGWYYIRSAFLGIAAALATIGLITLWGNRKKIVRSVPDFFRYRPLMGLMIKRDFFVRYRRSILGIFWTLLNPLANMIILTIVFSNLFQNEIEHFAAYVLSGNILFGCFSESTGNGMTSILGNAGMLKKVYVPKYIFPISKTIVPFINLLFSILAMFVVMGVTGVPFRPQMLMIPLCIVYLLVFCVGMSLILSTLYVFFRDIQYLYNIVLTALMYMSAIFYDIGIVPVQYMPLFALNPMLHYIRFFRSVSIGGVWPPLSDHVMCAGIAVVTLCLGLFVFYKRQDQFILHI